MKYFTLKQAEALIPELETIFKNVLALRAKAESKVERLRSLEQIASTPAHELAIERSQLQFLINKMNKALDQILQLGVLPKGLDPALVDFPFRLKDQDVYLCWRLGEKTIQCYHGLNEGFANRKELPQTSLQR